MLVFITLGDFIFYACVLLLLADAIGMSNLHLWARLEFALLPGLIVLIRLRRPRPWAASGRLPRMRRPFA